MTRKLWISLLVIQASASFVVVRSFQHVLLPATATAPGSRSRSPQFAATKAKSNPNNNPLGGRQRHRLNGASDPALLSEIDALWQTYPYAAAALVCGFKASAADMVAQTQELQKEEDKAEKDNSSKAKVFPLLAATPEAKVDTKSAAIMDGSSSLSSPSFSFLSNADWKRNAAFIAYGALYQGITQEFFYNHLYPIWFGTGTDVETVLTKVTFTLLVQTTILTLPSLYASKALLEGFSLQEAGRQYLYDIQYQGLLQKFYILWGPVLCLTFSVIPEHLRVTFIALISFFWLIILSNISSNDRDNNSSNIVTTATE